MRFKKSEVDELFEKSEHQSEVLIGLYRKVFPDFDDIEKINGFPHCGREMALHICGKLMEFDRKHHPNVLSGGLWLNNGFSADDSLKPWGVSISHLEESYKKMSEAA